MKPDSYETIIVMQFRFSSNPGSRGWSDSSCLIRKHVCSAVSTKAFKFSARLTRGFSGLHLFPLNKLFGHFHIVSCSRISNVALGFVPYKKVYERSATTTEKGEKEQETGSGQGIIRYVT